MKTKEDLIKEAWELSEFTVEYDECNGWSLDTIILDSFYNELFDTTVEYSSKGILYAKIRPKSLRGIEDNNGWTPIKNIEDIPKENILGFIIIDSSGKKQFTSYRHLINVLEEGWPYTHYQPIYIPTKNPLY